MFQLGWKRLLTIVTTFCNFFIFHNKLFFYRRFNPDFLRREILNNLNLFLSGVWPDPEELQRRPGRAAARRSLRLPAPTRLPVRWLDSTSPGPSSSSACTSSPSESGSKSRSKIVLRMDAPTYLMYILGTNLFLYFCTFLLHLHNYISFLFKLKPTARNSRRHKK